MATEDEFTFHVSLAETKVPSEFRFRFRIVSLRLEQLDPNSVYLNETTQGLLGLRFRTFPLPLPPSSIKYTLVHPPRYGFLTSTLNNNNAQITTFTQADLGSSRVMYSFKLTPYSPMTDYFLFNVSTSHLDLSLTSGPFRCDIHHSTRKKPTGVTIKPLIVIEGKMTNGCIVLDMQCMRISSTTYKLFLKRGTRVSFIKTAPDSNLWRKRPPSV
jgi:hypothetical protein